MDSRHAARRSVDALRATCRARTALDRADRGAGVDRDIESGAKSCFETHRAAYAISAMGLAGIAGCVARGVWVRGVVLVPVCQLGGRDAHLSRGRAGPDRLLDVGDLSVARILHGVGAGELGHFQLRRWSCCLKNCSPGECAREEPEAWKGIHQQACRGGPGDGNRAPGADCAGDGVLSGAVAASATSWAAMRCTWCGRGCGVLSRRERLLSGGAAEELRRVLADISGSAGQRVGERAEIVMRPAI